MINLVSFVIAAYLVARFVLRMRVPLLAKAGLALLVLLLAKQHWIVARLTGGTLASPEIPRTLLLVLSIGFGFLMLLTLLALLRDIVGGVLWLVSRQNGRAWLASHRVDLALAATAMVLAGVGVWQAVQVPAVREVDIELANLPAGMDGYRIVQLTDLHASRLLQRPWMQAVVDRTNALHPDLIVITGDLVDGSVDARRDDVAPLAQLSARDGVFGVPGNHEYYAGYLAWMQAFNQLGIRMLVNAHVVIGNAGDGIVLAGVADRVGPPRGLPGPDVARALRAAPAGKPIILLEHQPRHARDNRLAGASLQLSGHTHGGQIRGYDLAVARANNGFVSGLYRVGDMQLYVSNGAGLWPGFPYRLGRPSEITVIKLRIAK